MRRPEELESLQSAIMQRIAEAATAGDVRGVKQWGDAAEQCQLLQQATRDIDGRIAALQKMLDGEVPVAVSPASKQDTSRGRTDNGVRPRSTSARAEGAAARKNWVQNLAATGLLLYGSGKRYQTSQGRTVAIAFANELPEYPNKWWLGLPDEATDVAVLLCKQKNGAVLDLVLPVGQLGMEWKALSRSNGQIKFNVRRDGSDLLLLVPGREPVSVKRYCGIHGALR